MKRIVRSAESWTFVPAGDRPLPPEQQTVFTLRPMTIGERSHAHDSLTRTVTNGDGRAMYVSRTLEVTLEVVLTHVESIENFPVGAPRPWPKTREERIAYVEMFDDAVLEEVGDEIWARSKLGVPEKNFSPPGRTSSSPDALATTPSIAASTAAPG